MDGIITSTPSVAKFLLGRLDALCKELTSICIQKIVDTGRFFAWPTMK